MKLVGFWVNIKMIVYKRILYKLKLKKNIYI
jgi:hypothetical protein